MAPPMIPPPARTLSPFTISSLKNFALSGGVSVGGEESEGGDPSVVKWSDGGGGSEAKWCDGVNPSGSVVAGPDPVSCGGGCGISNVPEPEG